MKRLLALLSLLTALTIASANANIYLDFTNSDTEGESTAESHNKWIEVSSFSFGVLNTVTVGGAGGASSGKASFADFEITKFVDKSSPALMTAAATGSRYSDLVLEVTRNNSSESGEIVFFKVEMKDVYIESVRSSHSDGDGTIEENVVIKYGSHKITTYSTNSKTGEVSVSGTHQWSVITNQAQF